jgi:hypothetical protein
VAPVEIEPPVPAAVVDDELVGGPVAAFASVPVLTAPVDPDELVDPERPAAGPGGATEDHRAG